MSSSDAENRLRILEERFEQDRERAQQEVRQAQQQAEQERRDRERAERNAEQAHRNAEQAQRNAEKERRDRERAEQNAQQERRGREQAEQRVEEGLRRTRDTTLPEFLDACHTHLSLGLAVQAASLSTKGEPANAANKLRPEMIRPWTTFPVEQELIWNDLMDSDFVGDRHFTAVQVLEGMGRHLRERQLSSELDLNVFERSTVEDQVSFIVKRLHASPTLRAKFCLKGSVTYENHANSLDADVQQSSRPGTRTRRSPRLQARKEGSAAKASSSVKPPPKASTYPRADQFCVYNTSSDVSERSPSNMSARSRVAAYIIEYKAPHKMTLAHISEGLHDVRLDDIVVQRDGENFKDGSRRLIAAAISQTFSYMVEAGLEYGYVCTGEAFIFLQVPDDPTTVYYFLSVPNGDVGLSTGWGSDTSAMNRLHLTAVGQVLAFTLRALRAPRAPIRDHVWRERARSQLKCWEVLYEDILDEISVHETPPSAYRAPAHVQDYLRMSPVRLRPRKASHDRQSPLQSASRPGSDDDFDPDTPSRPSRQPPSTTGQPSQPSTRGGDALTGRETGYQGRSRQYCTHLCLAGLVSGGLLDKDCPNVRDHGSGRHRIDQSTFLQLLGQQLSTDRDTDVVNLGVWGARGALFQVTLTSHGYTVAAKGTPAHFVQHLRHEAAVYRRLQAIQGVHIPVCLGSVALVRPYIFEGAVHLVRMLLLSFGGKPLYRFVNAENRLRLVAQVQSSMRAIHDLGVIHGDAMPRNVLWNPQTERVMMIDFERATLLPGRMPLGSVSPNRKRKRAAGGAKVHGAFKREVIQLTRELSAFDNGGD
ncbi:MAG: hypothetical protein M1832_005448 [Thelocarpon impressellum]|nr:MAG: hypothetical protein M1832_005448 [Thelocarpon impressellum]